MTGTPLTDEQVNFVRRHFSDMTNQELADAIGCSKSAVSGVQKRFRLHKSLEHRHASAVKAGKASVVARGNAPIVFTPEMLARRTASYKRTFLEEQIRYRWGLPQLTKIRVRKEPKAKRGQRSYLKSLGYILDEQKCVAYYTDDTTRAVKMERDWSKKVKQYYKFLPYENKS